jgi:hypothetical protein
MKRIDLIKNLSIISKELNSKFFADAVFNGTSTGLFYEKLIASKTSHDRFPDSIKKNLDSSGINSLYVSEVYNKLLLDIAPYVTNTSQNPMNSDRPLINLGSHIPIILKFLATHKAIIDSLNLLNSSLSTHQELFINNSIDTSKNNKNIFVFTIVSEDNVSFSDFSDIIETLNKLLNYINSEVFKQVDGGSIKISAIDSGSDISIFFVDTYEHIATTFSLLLSFYSIYFAHKQNSSSKLKAAQEETYQREVLNVLKEISNKVPESSQPNPETAQTCIAYIERLISNGAVPQQILNEQIKTDNRTILLEHIKPKELKQGDDDNNKPV